MIYIKWTNDDINGLEKLGIFLLWTEVDENGFVTRELGFNNDGFVVHKCPHGSKLFGLFDNQAVVLTRDKDCIEPEKFNEIWNRKSEDVK